VNVRYVTDDVDAAAAFTPTISVSRLMWILLPHLLRLLVAICGCYSAAKGALAGNQCWVEPNPGEIKRGQSTNLTANEVRPLKQSQAVIKCVRICGSPLF
jgi:L-cysteine desulfidase